MNLFELKDKYQRCNHYVKNGARFTEKVYAVVKKIPRGKTMTYKEVARRAGRPLAYRAVGNILNKNYDSTIPCYRVIRSDGKTGGYNNGVKEKIRKLKKEGYTF